MNSQLEIISSEIKDSEGNTFKVEYRDSDSFEDLPLELCTQTYGVCLYKNKLVIGFGGKKQAWGLIGGSIEKGERLEETLSREIQEESNMKVLSSKPVGYQKVTDLRKGRVFYQLRYMCIVEPYGNFVSDPDIRGITKIKLIDPEDYKQYFDWGKIGERIIQRAIELKNTTN